MLLYESTKSGFLDDLLGDELVPEIKRGYRNKGLGIGSDNEVRAWRNSFQYMYKVLRGSAVPDNAGVAIEFNAFVNSISLPRLL